MFKNICLLNTGLEKTGDIKPTVSGTVNVPSSDTDNPTNCCTIWLAPGIYLIEGTAKFTLPKQAQIEIHIKSVDDKHAIGDTALTLPAGVQWLKNTGILKVDDTSKQIVLQVRQNSGSTISCTGHMAVMQIK